MSDPAYEFAGDTLKLEGLLSVETVSRYFDIGINSLEQSTAGLKVDLAKSDIVGSAAIALLIAWQRRALQLEKEFSIVNAPTHFLDMARVSGVSEILPIVEGG
tara:strand:- start:2371 stop:2679 length:309 start_codon:yes stop_codon:yes gene_type:complete